jgi:NDP-sugar pyrophosphorylase family protein
MKPELVVMAAGMGSRYGGLKQLETVGPSGETVMDYSIYDAQRAGVERVIFVIRRELEAAFRKTVGARYERWMEVSYVFQELDSLPRGFNVPEGRVKPWDTGHAVLSARSAVKAKAPFIVINADDFYGSTAYNRLAHWLQENPAKHAMVAFRLVNTLSEHGSVARGICRVATNGYLLSITEHTGLERDGDGAKEIGENGQNIRFTGQEPVSMNLWGFQPEFMEELETRFAEFMTARGTELKAEFFLPSVVDALVTEGRWTVQVLDTPDRWFGVTYREDKALVEKRIGALVAQGIYPESLWS